MAKDKDEDTGESPGQPPSSGGEAPASPPGGGGDPPKPPGGGSPKAPKPKRDPEPQPEVKTMTPDLSEMLATLLESANLDQNPDSLMPVLGDDYKLTRSDPAAFTPEERFLAALATMFYNIEKDDLGYFDAGEIPVLIQGLDALIEARINDVIHRPEFQELEAVWRSIETLIADLNFKSNIGVDLLDASKEELRQDFKNNAIDLSKAALFDKVYVAEYDQFGGKPFGAILGLFEFSNTPDDIRWLQTMGKLANAAHAPFLASAHPKFFGCETAAEVASFKDLEGEMDHPKYGMWNALRQTEEAAYLGLTFPRFVLRLPYHPDANPCRDLNFTERVQEGQVGGLDPSLVGQGLNRNGDGYLWGSSAVLLAKNLFRSFDDAGWCQYLRGPKGGGMVAGLPAHTFEQMGRDEIKLPVEIAIPDYREWEFARCGFIPLVYKKGSAEACFFSVQSVKRPMAFKDPKDSENSQLVANLSYTFSVTRIAHYVKSIMRDNIGSSANHTYIQKVLTTWLNDYVTTFINPDDLTLRRYPFKAARVAVSPRAGQIGFYDASISVLPHIQFEGMDVELLIESRLG